MGYDSSDLNILDEMIKKEAKLELTGNKEKKEVTLNETDGKKYSVTIKGVPQNTIIIKTDAFEAPKSIFQNKKHECKRSDFVMVSDEDKKKFILVIEMKAGKADNKEVIQQLKGSQCFIAYCREIGKSFWQKKNFLQGYDYRFICFYNININKRSTKDKRSLNDYPEKMLKISGKECHFKRLVNLR